MPDPDPSTGVLLLNLGTPRAPTAREVGRYLREFLMDPRVITMAAPLRWALVHGMIVPLRARSSARLYQSVWTDAGSPLLVHGQALCQRLQAALGSRFRVALAMRYGEPSIDHALDELASAGVVRLVCFPLFPQRAEATTGTASARVRERIRGRWSDQATSIVEPFFQHPATIQATAALAAQHLEAYRPDHVLFSYHGLPKSALSQGSGSAICLQQPDCCDALRDENASCYRAQCHATTRALARKLELEAGTWSTSFQSRLGRAEWIRPYTDQHLETLRARGIRRLAVMTPAFVADCLETLEEIGIRARERWRSLGGEELLAVPCPNAEPEFVNAAAALIHESLDQAVS